LVLKSLAQLALQALVKQQFGAAVNVERISNSGGLAEGVGPAISRG
jgi:hypothetical protein